MLLPALQSSAPHGSAPVCAALHTRALYLPVTLSAVLAGHQRELMDPSWPLAHGTQLSSTIGVSLGSTKEVRGCSSQDVEQQADGYVKYLLLTSVFTKKF